MDSYPLPQRFTNRMVKKSTNKGTGGRPTSYKDEYCEQAYKLCLLGVTDKNLAIFFEVVESTVNKWKLDHPEFSESLKEGKYVTDAKVAESLYKRAIGCECPDTKFATYEGQITDEREYTKHYPPDPVAAIFWLKNRQPELWRDKQEVKHSGSVVIVERMRLSRQRVIDAADKKL